MKNIEVFILNPDSVRESEKMLALTARLTQKGHKIHNIDDLVSLYNKPYNSALIESLCALPHPTIQKFGVINIAVVGASRRFLAQITRHQNEVKFMSASLQYSDYSDSEVSFAVPYNLLGNHKGKAEYLKTCTTCFNSYCACIENGVDNDSAGYLMPQGLRNALIISATPYQWKHIISQRVCRRNTDEMRIVMLKIWERLISLSQPLFSAEITGPFCMKGDCKEGKMSCRKPIAESLNPTQILKKDYPLLFKEADNED